MRHKIGSKKSHKSDVFEMTQLVTNKIMKQRLPLSSGVILQSRYRIVKQLGHGGMGVVYEASDDRVRNRLVALKETYADDDENRRAFEREAELLANTEHEAFPRVIDYFTEAEGCFLVMELIRGEDLGEMLTKRGQPFESEQVLKWADQILDALGDLHENYVIHRDIKPSNLKLTPKGRIKLLDFGIAKGLTGDALATTTIGSMAAATLQYAPLEQVLPANPDWYLALSVSYPEKTTEILQSGTDARSDLYALGATLYQLLTAQLPVNAPTRALSLWAGKGEKLRPAHEINPQVSAAVSVVIQQSMELEREKRPASASEMRQMLSEALSQKEFADAVTLPFVPAIPIPPLETEKPLPTQTEHTTTTEKTLASSSTAQKSVITQLKKTDVPEIREKTLGSSKPLLFWGGIGAMLFVLAGFAISVLIQTSAINSEDNTANSASGEANINLNSANPGTIDKVNVNSSPANALILKPQSSPISGTNSNKTTATETNTSKSANADSKPKSIVREPKSTPKVEDAPPVKPKKPTPAGGSRKKKQTQNPDCIFNGNC